MSIVLTIALLLFLLSALYEFHPRLRPSGHSCWLIWAAIFLLIYGPRLAS